MISTRRAKALSLRFMIFFVVLSSGCAAPRERHAGTLPDPVFTRSSRPPARPSPRIQARVAPRRPAAREANSGLPGEIKVPGGVTRDWRYIVIHHSGSSAGGAVRFHRYHKYHNKWDELGYHFVIGNGTDTPDGFVEVGPRWRKQKHGAHCKTADNRYNEYGVGICLVGDFENGGGPSSAQMSSLKKLIRYLVRETSVPPNHILTHGGITHRTACPGRHFPMAALRQSLQGLERRLY